MFFRIGHFVSRHWHWMLVAWVIALVLVTKVAPQWEDVVRDGEFSYLPEDSPSRLGEQLFVKAYKRDPMGSSVVIVVRRVRPEGLITEEEAIADENIKISDFAFIQKSLKPRLERIKLLSDIIPFYSNSHDEQTIMLAEIEKELNGLPRQSKSARVDDVSLAIVTDWHYDFFQNDQNSNTDPNIKTSLETTFYERVISGLEQAKIPLEFVSPGLRKRLQLTGDTKKNRHQKIWESASLQLFENQERKSNPIISDIHTVGNKGWEDVLISKDKKASLVIIELTTEFLARRNRPVISRIERLIDPGKEGELRKEKNIPPGLDLALSGSATVGRDMRVAAEESASATELWTVLLVVILLIIIYRAPLLAIIPLITVGVSVHIARHCLAILGEYEIISLFSGVKTYVTVVLYGAGVDYCVFLMARYKEELDAGATSEEAMTKSIGNVGAALAASAGTTMVGIGMMVFAEFGKFRQAGVAMSLSIPFVLIASVTFTPAMLRLFGRWAFWPHVQSEQISQSVGWLSPTSFVARAMNRPWFDQIWEKIGDNIQKRPATIWFACVALMLPFAVVGVVLFNHQTFGLLEELPQEGSNVPRSVIGTRAVQKHFSAGMTGPVSVILKNDQIDFGRSEGEEIIRKAVGQLKSKMKELHIADIRGVSHPMGLFVAEPTNLGRLGMRARKRRINNRYVGTIEVAQKDNQPKRDNKADADKNATEDNVEETGEEEMPEKIENNVTFIEIIFDDNPFSRNSITQFETLKETIQQLFPEYTKVSDIIKKEGQQEVNQVQQMKVVGFIGSTASIRDLKAVTGRDQVRVDTLVILGVFLILVLLLRRVAVSGYLILSVFFSYLVTLGVTITFFTAISPGEFAGLDWKVPMFLFTILIAVGEDYNIYLMTRIEEEQIRHGLVKGVTVALSKTGSIISSCGLIMAGTFLSLMAGSLVGMQQLGFALAFGVMLDTFVVRPVLVPAYLVMLHSGRFGAFGKLLGYRPETEQEQSNNNQSSSPETALSSSSSTDDADR